LLQTTTSALSGASATPPGPSPIANGTVNLPQAPAGIPGAGIPGLSSPGNPSSLLPFPLPNLGGTNATVAAPPATAPGAPVPSAPPATVPGASGPPAPPATVPGASASPVPGAVPGQPPAGSWSPLSALP
jgi:hypothetical protein